MGPNCAGCEKAVWPVVTRALECERAAPTLAAMGLQAFERRLERLVEGVFTKAFRSGLQPLEIGRRLVRELDAGRTVGVHGVVVPNHFVVTLSPADSERFATFRDALARELADAVREHARDENYHFVGPVDGGADRGRAPPAGRSAGARRRSSREREAGSASLVLPDGRRGRARGRRGDDRPSPRLRGAALRPPGRRATTPQVRRGPEGFRVVDLGSTNGTTVNGTIVSRAPAARRRRDRRRQHDHPLRGELSACPTACSRS